MDPAQASFAVSPPLDMPVWPSLKDFQEPEETLRWRDVPLGTFRVLALYDHGRNKYGPSAVLKLQKEDGSSFLVWVPSSLFYAIEKRRKTNFILNLGAKLSPETGNVFFDFKLCSRLCLAAAKKKNLFHPPPPFFAPVSPSTQYFFCYLEQDRVY